MPTPAPQPPRPEHLPAFQDGLAQVLHALFGHEPTFGPWQAREAGLLPADEHAVVIGVTGAISGQLMLGASHAVAIALADRMLLGDEPATPAMAASAVAEVANMAAGACLTSLATQGVEADITEPTAPRGPQGHGRLPALRHYEVVAQVPAGPLRWTVGLAAEGTA